MRPLTSELLEAQQSASREPYVSVVVENSVRGLRRLDFALLDATAHPLARHGVAVAGDGSVTRVRMESGVVRQQRVTDPAQGPWGAWNSLGSGKGTQVACAAKGGRVAIVYTDAAGTGIKLRESADSGATYGAEVAVATASAAVSGIAVAYKNAAGDLAIAWAAGTGVAIIKRASGAFGGVSSQALAVASLSGLAMTYGADWDLVLTGVEAGTLRPALWTLVHGDGNDAPPNTWGTLLVQVRAEADAQVTYAAPAIAFTDAYRINFVESGAYAGGVTRVYRTALHPLSSFVAGAFTFGTPAPAAYTGAQGLAIAAEANGAGYAYESAPDAVYRAPQEQVLLDVTDDVIAVDVSERAHRTYGHIDIDNADGAYAGAPAQLRPGNLVAVSWGYRTESGAVASRMADMWVRRVEHLRDGGLSVLRLHVEGGWELLRRSHARSQVVHSSDSYLTVLARILSRAGLRLDANGASARAASVTPSFTVQPGDSGYDAALRALALLADRVRMRSLATAQVFEPLADDEPDYAFGATHPLHRLRASAEAAGVSQVAVVGAGVTVEAADFDDAAHGLGERALVRDRSSATAGAASATAAAVLRRHALDADAGELMAPPNCGQELYDVIEIADGLVSPDALRRRVTAIRWRFERRRAVYEQTLLLGPL